MLYPDQIKVEDWAFPHFLAFSLVAQLVKNLPAMWETLAQSLGWEDPLEKGTATHSSILAWRIQFMCHKASEMTEWVSLSLFTTWTRAEGLSVKSEESYFLLSKVKGLLHEYYNLDSLPFNSSCQWSFSSHHVIQGYVGIDS